MSSQPNQSLIDGIRCLQYLVSSDRAIGCRELARLMGTNATRVNRLLMTMAAIVITLGTRRLKPWVYFRPTAQTTSSRPAINRTNQDIWLL